MNKFKSRYSPDKNITPAQYLAEIACERRASYLKTNLPVYFWKLDEWRKYYIYQIQIANELLKVYNISAILYALNIDKCKKVFSLKNPMLIDHIKKYKPQVVEKQRIEIDIVTDSTGNRNRKVNILDKLNG